MKVFNLTDVSTDVLEQYQMLNHTIEVGGQSVGPGASIEVDEPEAQLRSRLEHFLAIGAVALDSPPEKYLGKAPLAAAPAPRDTLSEKTERSEKPRRKE